MSLQVATELILIKTLPPSHGKNVQTPVGTQLWLQLQTRMDTMSVWYSGPGASDEQHADLSPFSKFLLADGKLM